MTSAIGFRTRPAPTSATGLLAAHSGQGPTLSVCALTSSASRADRISDPFGGRIGAALLLAAGSGFLHQSSTGVAGLTCCSSHGARSGECSASAATVSPSVSATISTAPAIHSWPASFPSPDRTPNQPQQPGCHRIILRAIYRYSDSYQSRTDASGSVSVDTMVGRAYV
jgi:hypothetical protein